MSSTTRVALAGAAGSLGKPVLKALLDAGYHVTALTRHGSNSTSTLPKHANLSLKEVDYSSLESLKSALNGIKVVISTVTTTAAEDQKILIDAAVAVGVSRFIPSEFGSDVANPQNSKLPCFGHKIAIEAYLEEKSSQNSSFTYTLIYNSAFLDWGLQRNFLINTKEHSATLWDGGDRPFSVTRLSTIADSVVGVIEHLDLTANQVVRVHDGVTTQNKLIQAFKQKDSHNWDTTVKSTKDQEAESYAELSKEGEKDIMKAIFGFIYVAIFQEGRGSDFTGNTWNKKLGLPVLSTKEFESVIEKVIADL